MHLSSIVVVVVRLFAIYWAVSALIALAGTAGIFRFAGDTVWHLVTQLVLPAFYLLLAIIAWFFTGAVTRKVIQNHDPVVPMMDIRLSHFYSMGFLIVGLSMFLSNVGLMFQWVHWLAVNKAGDMLLNGSENNQISAGADYLIPGLLGLFIAFQSPRFGRLMAKKSQREEDQLKRARDASEL